MVLRKNNTHLFARCLRTSDQPCLLYGNVHKKWEYFYGFPNNFVRYAGFDEDVEGQMFGAAVELSSEQLHSCAPRRQQMYQHVTQTASKYTTAAQLCSQEAADVPTRHTDS